jgi:hypothetical protein
VPVVLTGEDPEEHVIRGELRAVKLLTLHDEHRALGKVPDAIGAASNERSYNAEWPLAPITSNSTLRSAASMTMLRK